MKKDNKKYVIGVDGGGTKTITALADLSANILKTVKTGPSSPRNVGIQKTAENIAKGINKVLKKNLDIVSVSVGLPAVGEEYKSKIKKIEKEILKAGRKGGQGLWLGLDSGRGFGSLGGMASTAESF